MFPAKGACLLREGQALDYCVSDKKLARARRQDTETCWQDVSDADLARFHASMFFMDAIGLRYYLPAFMIYGLHHIDNDEWAIVSSLLTVLGAHQICGKPHLERYQIVTHTQAQAIGGFLQYVAGHGEEFDRAEAGRIFRDYWSYYP